jgi:hypothetical protein
LNVAVVAVADVVTVVCPTVREDAAALCFMTVTMVGAVEVRATELEVVEEVAVADSGEVVAARWNRRFFREKLHRISSVSMN